MIGADRIDLARVAVERLSRRGFHVRDPEVDIFRTVVGDGVRVRAWHECGSLVFVDIDAIDLVMAGSDASFVDLIIDALDRAGCYCVPREVIVPCTAQRCEAAR